MKTINLHLCVVALAAVTLAAAAQAQDVFPPFEIGDDLQFRPETRTSDLALQTALVLPRAPALVQSTQQTARAGLAGWRERNPDLRNLTGDRRDGGVWGRIIGQYGDRERQTGDLTIDLDALPSGFNLGLLETRFESLIEDWAEGLDHGDDLDPGELQGRIDAAIEAGLDASGNLDYEQNIHGFNIGFDLLHGHSGTRAWLTGLTVGYIRSTTEFDDYKAWGADSKFDGDTVSAGAYGGFIAGSWYLDAALSYAWHKLDMSIPVLFLRPDGAILSADARTLAAQIDSGWRIPLALDRLYIEPLTGLTWVRADLDDANLQPTDPLTHGRAGSQLVFGRQESLRANIGLRFGGEWTSGNLTLSGDLGVRNWREFERETEAALDLRGDIRDLSAPGSDDPGTWRLPAIQDHTAGSYTDISLSGGLRTADGRLAAGLNLGQLSGGGYRNHSVTANMRYQW